MKRFFLMLVMAVLFVGCSSTSPILVQKSKPLYEEEKVLVMGINDYDFTQKLSEQLILDGWRVLYGEDPVENKIFAIRFRLDESSRTMTGKSRYSGTIIAFDLREGRPASGVKVYDRKGDSIVGDFLTDFYNKIEVK